MCFHSTSVGVDHVSEQFTGDLQGSGSTERCVEGGQGSSTSEALITPNGAIPASERTLQTPPYRAPRHCSLYHLSIQIIFPLRHHHLLFRCFHPSCLAATPDAGAVASLTHVEILFLPKYKLRVETSSLLVTNLNNDTRDDL